MADSYQDKIGLNPQLREILAGMASGMSGDISIGIKANENLTATASAWSKVVDFWLEDSNGRIMDWYNGTGTAGIADTSTAGTASVDDATPAFVNGRGQVTVSGDEASWIATETVTLTIDVGSIMGTDPASVNYVITVV